MSGELYHLYLKVAIINGHYQLSSKSHTLLGLLKTPKTLYTHSSPSNFVLWHVNVPQ